METSEVIRKLVRSLYDAQKLRIQVGNRVFAGLTGETLDPVWAERAQFHARQLETVERELLKDVKKAAKTVDIWPWLEGVKGCGPAMSGVLIAEVGDPARFATVSKLWAYAGLHVINGAAARRRRGEKANWNQFLKTKMLGVLAPSFLKCRSPYAEFYYNYKTRLENKPCNMPPEKHKRGAMAEDLLPNGCTPSHMHNKALRYMTKQFLSDFLVKWRELRGLPVRPPYFEEYLGRIHHT